SNGAEIYTTDDELIEQHIIHSEKMEQLWHIGNNRGITKWILDSDAVIVQERRTSDISEHEWLNIGYDHLDEEDRLYVKEQLRQVQDLEVTKSTHMNFEVNEKGVNKAEG